MKWPTITPISTEKKLAKGVRRIPVIGSDTKIQLNQTPEYGIGGPTSESQITLKAAKTAIKETKVDFPSFFNEHHFSSLRVLLRRYKYLYILLFYPLKRTQLGDL